MKEFAGKFCFVNPRKISRSSIYDPSELKLRKPWIKESNVCFVWNRTKYNISLKIKVEALQKVKTVWKGEQIMDHSPLFLNYKRNIQAIVKVTFRLCASILVGYSRYNTILLGNLSVESWRSNHDRRIMSKNQGVYTALKSAVNSSPWRS